jgi:F-type H+-transporting ATPase subunit epsilon
MATFTLDIVTPDRVVLSDEAVALVAPGVIGSFGVLANHAPLLSELAIGVLRYRRETGEETRLAVAGGFIQVFNNQVTVLAEAAERAGEIDAARARRARDLARERYRDALTRYDEPQIMLAEASLERALNRLRVAGG